MIDVSTLSCESKSSRKEISIIVRIQTKSTEDSDFFEDEAETKIQEFGRNKSRFNWIKKYSERIRKAVFD